MCDVVVRSTFVPVKMFFSSRSIEDSFKVKTLYFLHLRYHQNADFYGTRFYFQYRGVHTAILFMHNVWQALTTLQIGRKQKHHHPCYPVLKKSMRSHKHGSTFASACKQLCSWPCESTRPAGLTQAGILMSPKHTLPDAGKKNKKTTIYFRRDIIKLFLNSLSIQMELAQLMYIFVLILYMQLFFWYNMQFLNFHVY